MRIAIVAPPWVPVPPVGYGGTEIIIDCLARGYKRAGHDVLLYTVPESTCPVPQKSILPSAARDRLNWSEVEMRHVVNAYEAVSGYDIVHDHTLIGPVYSERFPDMTVVSTQHHPYSENFVDVYRASEHRVPLVAISKAQAAEAPDFRKQRVIHHGLDPNDFSFNPTASDYFLFLGRMSPNKGAHRAAAAARAAGVPLKIAARLEDFEGEREYFEQFVKPLLGDGVEFVGEVQGPEKMELLRGARALINPIRWAEPFGLVMIEAFACGTPVITFPEGAAPEIVDQGRTGYLCKDEADMARRIRMIDRIDRSECRRVMETYFCADRMVAEYIAYFEELLEAKQQPSIDLREKAHNGSAVVPVSARRTLPAAPQEKFVRKAQ